MLNRNMFHHCIIYIHRLTLAVLKTTNGLNITFFVNFIFYIMSWMKSAWFKVNLVIKHMVHKCGRNINIRCRFYDGKYEIGFLSWILTIFIAFGLNFSIFKTHLQRNHFFKIKQYILDYRITEIKQYIIDYVFSHK